jgi:hypothetical protein
MPMALAVFGPAVVKGRAALASPSSTAPWTSAGVLMLGGLLLTYNRDRWAAFFEVSLNGFRW